MAKISPKIVISICLAGAWNHEQAMIGILNDPPMVKQITFLGALLRFERLRVSALLFFILSFFPSSHLHLREVVTWTIWAKCNEKMP